MATAILHDLIQSCDVRSPGSFKPDGTTLKLVLSGNNKIERLAFTFKEGTLISPSANLIFTFKAVSIDLIKPDILKGDIGFPEINIENENGEVYRLKRGNIKDFLDIHTLDDQQAVEIPLSIFIYNIDLLKNASITNKFWQYPIRNVCFDFLGLLNSVIELYVGDIQIVSCPPQAVALQDLVVVQKVGTPDGHPVYVTESSKLSLSFHASHLVPFFCATAPRLYFSISSAKDSQEDSFELTSIKRFVEFVLPSYGQHYLYLSLQVDDSIVCKATIPVVRSISSLSPSSKLGISDAGLFCESFVASGALRRTVISLKSFTYKCNKFEVLPNHRLAIGLPSAPCLEWVVALKGMPRWLSRFPDKHDYYRYGPRDFELFRQFVRYIIDLLVERKVRYIEPWNEANVIHEWNDSLDILFEIQRVYYEETRGRDVVLLTPSTTSWDFSFIEKLLEYKFHHQADAIAMHGYTYEPRRYQSFISDVRALHLHSGLKIYLTEIGFRYPSFSLYQQALYLTLFSVETCFNDFLGSCIWFRFQNCSYETAASYNQNSSTGYAMIGYSSSYARSMFSAFQACNYFLHSVVSTAIVRGKESSLYLGTKPATDESAQIDICVSYCPAGLHLEAANMISTGSVYDLFGNEIQQNQIRESQLIYVLNY